MQEEAAWLERTLELCGAPELPLRPQVPWCSDAGHAVQNLDAALAAGGDGSVESLRLQIEELQLQLQEERAARKRVEEKLQLIKALANAE